MGTAEAALQLFVVFVGGGGRGGAAVSVILLFCVSFLCRCVYLCTVVAVQLPPCCLPNTFINKTLNYIYLNSIIILFSIDVPWMRTNDRNVKLTNNRHLLHKEKHRD
jgi:hypothetical protein